MSKKATWTVVRQQMRYSTRVDAVCTGDHVRRLANVVPVGLASYPVVLMSANELLPFLQSAPKWKPPIGKAAALAAPAGN